MDHSLDHLRRRARDLKRGYEEGDPQALQRLKVHPPRARGPLKHADFLHVIAREQNFESWPRLKFAAETIGLDRAGKLQQLKIALHNGRTWAAEALLADTPDLADGQFGLQVSLYRLAEVERVLAADPQAATRVIGNRTPILFLAFSRWIHAHPELERDMLAIGELLVAHGADVDDGLPWTDAPEHRLSALYGAIGHADNMVLARWLLEHGANPNDNESLYHSTELGHHEGLRMLLEHGAEPAGTNALLRAMDFHDHAAVELLLAHGAKADDFNPAEVGGEQPWVVPALHQAARRLSDRRMAELLLDGGADPERRYQGVTAYAMARVYGNRDVAGALEARGADRTLSREEALLAGAADGEAASGKYIDPETLPAAYRDILRELVHLPGRLDQMRRLVALGVEHDRPAGHEKLTPIHAAGWEGKPDVLAWLLSLKPDLTHVNGYGGTLLGTILHGSENCPARDDRDHIACLTLALEHGLALPRREIAGAARPDVAAFLSDWAEARPGQVVDGG